MESKNFLEKVNLCFENSFSIAAEISSFVDNKNDCMIASKRALSYNPVNNKVLTLAKSIEPPIRVLRELIEKASISLQSDTENPKIWRSLSSYYLALGDFPNSFATLANISTRIEIKDNDFLFAAGVIYAHFHYQEVAIGFFQQILKNNPSFYLASDIGFRLGILLRDIKKFDESNEMFKSIQVQPPYKLTQNDIQLQIAHNFSLMGRYDASLSIYQQLHFMYPDNIKLTQQYFITKTIAYPINNLREVQQELLMEIQKVGYDPLLALIDARISMKIDDTLVAYEKCKKCITYCSDSPYFWISLGVIYFKYGQNDYAIKAFKSSIYLRYDIPETWLNIGLIYELNGDIANAGKVYKTGFEKCPNCPTFAVRLQNPVHEYSMLDIPDSKFFTQIPEKFAKDYMAAVPTLPRSLYPESITDEDLKNLCATPEGLF